MSVLLATILLAAQTPLQADSLALRDLATADAAARGDYMKIVRTQSKALARIKAMLDRDEIKSPNDFLVAANLISNAPGYESRMLDHEFTMSALMLGSKEAGKRVRLSWDRLQYDGGHPTRLGAMFGRSDKDGKRPPLNPDPQGPPPIVAAVLGGTAPAPKADDPELKALMDADQKDRQNLKTAADWDRMSANDVPRRARVLAILGEGKASSGADLYNAALVLQHGEGYRDYMLAHELCLGAIARGYGDAAWLVSRTYDRMLESGGHAQRFATQKRGDASGTFYIMSLDLPGPSDAMRGLFKSPTRAEAKKDHDEWLASLDK